MTDWAFVAAGDRPAMERLAAGIEPVIEPFGVASSLVEDPPDSERWTFTVYATDEDVGAIDQILDRDAGGHAFVRERLPDEDWVARSLEGLSPVVTDRFVVHGAHDRARVSGGRIGIEIEAGRAFGTGHHGTTVGCLRAIERIVARGRISHALDLGTGTGVLAIAIARLGRIAVLATDIDPVAVEVAAHNARANGVGPRVRCVLANGPAHPHLNAKAPFPLVVANILAGPLVRMAGPIARTVTPDGGRLVLSGLLDRQARPVLAAYRARGMVPLRRESIGGWTTLTLARGRPIP